MNFFVYGTLKVGGHFAGRFNTLRKTSKPAVLANYTMYGIGHPESSFFPGIIPGGNNTVTGEVHSYDEKDFKQVLKSMDMIEGYDENFPEQSLYLRKKVEVKMEDGSTEEVLVYIYNKQIQDYYKKFENGIWDV